MLDGSLVSIGYQDPAWIAVAFLFGLAFKGVRLPPMVGFLVAGFILNLLGAENDAFLQEVADLGVTLLLFTIGLKLRLHTLIRPEIWATTVVHMGGSILVTGAAILALGAMGVLVFDGISFGAAILVAFALSFSSTVFAVKTLEDRGALASRYGQVAIGILVMQDIAAVVFLAVSSGKLPSIWALGLLALIPGRHVLIWLMDRSGHKELLTVFGFVMALGAGALFESVGMKGDLGALLVGVLLAGHAKAEELSKTLLGFKDVFLVCFFLTIGLTGLPTLETAGAALLLLLLLPFKTALFFYLLTRFKMRARGAALGSLLLGNYSEFGLIVATIAIGAGMLQSEWLTVIALALSASFVLASPINVFADRIFHVLHDRLERFETEARLPGDENILIKDARILVFGMGRIGRAAYDKIAEEVDHAILGVDLDEEQVARHLAEGRRAVMGDATHPEFWSRIAGGHDHVEIILLAMPNHSANISAAQHLRKRGYTGPIVATSLFAEQEESLLENGIDAVFNLYAEAGSGAATKMEEVLKKGR